MEPKIIREKILFVIGVYGIYYTGIYILLKPDIFQDNIILIYLILQYTAGIIDTIIRPLETEKKESQNFEKYLIFLFFITPFLLILSLVEEQNLYMWRNDLISIVGLVIYIIGGSITLLGRIQLGRLATGILVIREDHELVTRGIYKYIRHPIYAGGFIGVFAWGLVTQSIIVFILTFILYFKILNDRAIYEEGMLSNEFGEEYTQYKEKSKRFIPFLF